VQELSRKGISHSNHTFIIEKIRALISEIHELKLAAVILLKPLTLPKTTSGKIRRVACKEAYLKNELKTVASWQQTQNNEIALTSLPDLIQKDSNSIAQWIINWIALRLNISEEHLSKHQLLTQIGLDSIDGMTLTHELSKQLNLSLDPTLSWSYPSIQALSEYLERSACKEIPPKNQTPTEGVI